MKTATFKIMVVVTFEDSGEDDLRDQAFEALNEKYSFVAEQDFDVVEIVGDVEDAA
jgi:hypothetical protein